TGLTRPNLDLLRHLDRARAVGLLRVAARVGPEARQALDAGAGPALRVRAAAVRELLALVAGADGPNEAQRGDEEEGRGLDHVGVVVRVVVAVVLEQPPALAEELPHHGGRARPGVVRGGSGGETQPRGD
ncbi:unnamed protein product, partial [Pelagomonas calceolata]